MISIVKILLLNDGDFVLISRFISKENIKYFTLFEVINKDFKKSALYVYIHKRVAFWDVKIFVKITFIGT